MQELYDKRVLHRIMGVEPRDSMIEARERQPSGYQLGTSHQTSRLMESAWTNGQLNDETDYEDDHQRRHHSSTVDQDGGRYDIGRHTKKRRKTQRPDDHPVYFVADGDSRGDLSEGEVEEYGDADGDVHEDRGSRDANGISRHTRRKFWLGKAIEIGLADNTHA